MELPAHREFCCRHSQSIIRSAMTIIRFGIRWPSVRKKMPAQNGSDKARAVDRPAFARRSISSCRAGILPNKEWGQQQLQVGRWHQQARLGKAGGALRGRRICAPADQAAEKPSRFSSAKRGGRQGTSFFYERYRRSDGLQAEEHCSI